MIWKSKRSRDRNRTDRFKRRASRPEKLEARRLLAADPIHVGVVYLETDYLETDQDQGSDSQGDRFIVSFTGGAPDTELSELRIRTDKDGDGIVNAADFIVWRNNLGLSVTLPGDTTPGTVTQADYDVWVANYGNTAGSASLSDGAVPEPASAMLVVTGSLAICVRWRLA